MSTTKKGDAFEHKVFELTEQMLANNKFFFIPHIYKIHRKKRYYSKDRKADIIVDISIECFMPGVETPSFYIFIECKDYGKSIPVDDIEEFYSKITQIAGANVKGIFVSKSSLQAGAMNYAQSKMIAVWRVMPDDNVDIIFSYMTPNRINNIVVTNYINVFTALTSEDYTSSNQMYCLHGSKHYTEIDSLFRDIFSDIKTVMHSLE